MIRPPNSNVHMMHEKLAFSNVDENQRLVSLAENHIFVDDCSVFAFLGAAAIGRVANAFKSLDVAAPLQVV